MFPLETISAKMLDYYVDRKDSLIIDLRDEKEYAEAQRLIEILRYFEPISKDIVPSHSLLKEFLGGGDFKG